MSTALAQPDPVIRRTIVTPDLSKPAVGLPTLVAFFGGDHTVLLSLAHVLSVGPVDPATNEPTLTVAFPTRPIDERKLGSVRWSDAFQRVTGVQHFSHPDVKEGRAAIAWGGDGAIEILSAPEIPQPEGAGSDENPIFTRNVLEDQPTGEAVHEALIAQQGKAPEGSHQSPLTSEAGTTHGATVQPQAVETAENSLTPANAAPETGTPAPEVAGSPVVPS